jgi:subtilisin family serine protease
MGANVISNSWGGSQYSQALKDAIDASGAVVVCAAGNSGVNTDSKPQYPSAYTSSNIMAVAATDSNDNLASFSNYGVASVDIGAPGVNIRSTYKGGQFKYLTGSSMATPFVSGVAGLVKALYPGMSNSEIKNRILSSVDKLSSLNGKVLSGGRVNAARALGYSTTSPTPTVTPTPAPTQTSGTLTASFLASPLSGKKPLKVQFIDTSNGKPTSWYWNFGDGGISYQKNPVYYFRNKGVYSVRLTIYGGGKTSTIYKSRLITVT